MRVAIALVVSMLLAQLPLASASNDEAEQGMWPGEPVDNHVHMTWAAMTLEVNGWADDYPEIVDLMSAGESELGKTLWVVRLSDWSIETKEDGSPKEIVYIDGGHRLGLIVSYIDHCIIKFLVELFYFYSQISSQFCI